MQRIRMELVSKVVADIYATKMITWYGQKVTFLHLLKCMMNHTVTIKQRGNSLDCIKRSE